MEQGMNGLGLAGIAQAIPLPVSIVVIASSIAYFIRLLRFAVNGEALKILKHIALLMIAWSGVSIFFGFFISCQLLETAETISLVDIFLYGLRFGFLLMPMGFVLLCVPFLVWMKFSESMTLK